jgi:DNA-binding MarR family transcriptional regulator
LDDRKMPLFGRSFMRSIQTLKDTEMLTIERSDDDKRSGVLRLTAKAFELLDKALRPLR